MHSAPQSAFLGPFMDGTFVYRHISTSSLPVWVLVTEEEWKGRICGKEFVGGRKHGRPCDDDDGPKVTGAVCHFYVSCQIELGKLFSWKECRPKCGVVLLQEQLAVDVRQALEGSASYVLDEDFCPSTEDRA
jgi:hypothetical protein